MIETLGTRLRALREARHLNQKQVADSIDVTRSSICCYENDTRQPSLDVLLKLAHLYRTSTDYLLGNSPKEVLNIGDLSEPERQIVFNLIDYMLRKDPPVQH